jgi:hypothetical protein
VSAPEPPAQARPWQPANDVEVALVRAVTAGDRQEYFRLVAVADLYLPTLAADRDRPGPQRFITADLVGQTYLTVFTSVPSLAAVMIGQADAYRVTNYPELRRKWPVPHWRLAVNPGTPIDAYVRIEAVEAAALGDLAVPTAAEILADGVAPDGVRPEAAMTSAAAELVGAAFSRRSSAAELVGAAASRRSSAAAGDVDGYIRALLEVDVILPVAEPVDAARILQPGFPWRLVPDGESVAVEVFTSADRYRAAGLGELPTVTVPFTALVLAWPDDSCWLSIDPGSPLAVRLPGGHVLAFALWLPGVAPGAEAADGVSDRGIG